MGCCRPLYAERNKPGEGGKLGRQKQGKGKTDWPKRRSGELTGGEAGSADAPGGASSLLASIFSGKRKVPGAESKDWWQHGALRLEKCAGTLWGAGEAKGLGCAASRLEENGEPGT
jgi:hypothetical protein